MLPTPCNPITIYRILTSKEIVLAGLEGGQSAALCIKDAGEKGRGVFAVDFISRGSYVTEYKYDKLYPARERKKFEDIYELNQELVYVLDTHINGRKMCIDATRRLYSIGRCVSICTIHMFFIFVSLRYINHSASPNVRPHPPLFVKGKYRVGFVALHDIEAGTELLWDYGHQRSPADWLRRRK